MHATATDSQEGVARGGVGQGSGGLTVEVSELLEDVPNFSAAFVDALGTESLSAPI